MYELERRQRKPTKHTPTRGDFDPHIISEFDGEWSYHRGPCNAGDVGHDFIRDINMATIEYSTHEKSCNSCSNKKIYLVYRDIDGVGVPIGLHIQARLDPDDFPGGAGASYSGDFKSFQVPVDKWLEVYRRPKK